MRRPSSRSPSTKVRVYFARPCVLMLRCEALAEPRRRGRGVARDAQNQKSCKDHHRREREAERREAGEGLTLLLQRQETRIAAGSGGVDGQRALGREAVEIMRSTGFWPGAR